MGNEKPVRPSSRELVINFFRKNRRKYMTVTETHQGTGLSVSTIRRTLRELTEEGVLDFKMSMGLQRKLRPTYSYSNQSKRLAARRHMIVSNIKNGGGTGVTAQQIAGETKLNVMTVQRILRDLVKEGVIVFDIKPGKHNKDTHFYSYKGKTKET